MASSSWASVGSSLLLFCLVFGMSATVELGSMRKQMQNKTALLIGVGLQFVILPFVGFVVVKSLNLPAAMGITLMVVTSSPGGSYSNWWCSIFNAELALSVTMTALSTLLSTIMLPANLVLYTRWTYDHDVVESLDWAALFLELFVVIGGIAAGMISSHLAARRGSTIMFHKRANVVGNVAGLALITLSAAISSTGKNDVKLWSQTPSFYVGVALPAVIGLCIATFLASHFDLDKPERVAVAVEACYQNTGIATSVAITMFRGTGDLNTAISVPLYYGLLEAIMLAGFCLICWKRGWTKAPPDHSLCKVITNSYEVLGMEATESEVAIEVVMGGGDSNQKQQSASPGRGDMVFSQTDNGAFVVDNEALAATKSNNNQTTESDASTCVSSSTTDEQQPQQQQQAGGGSPPRASQQQQQADDAEEPSSSSSEGRRNDDSLI